MERLLRPTARRGLIDYIAVEESLRKDVLDAKVVRGLFDMSDHYVVLAKVRLRGTNSVMTGNMHEIKNGKHIIN